MSVQHVELADVCSNRKRILVDTKTTAAVSALLPLASLRRTWGLGSTGSIDPLAERYSHFECCQRWVSRSPEGDLQRTRLLRREQGCSGPGKVQILLRLDLFASQLVNILVWLVRCQSTGEEFGSSLKVLRHPRRARTRSRGSLLLLQDSCAS